MSPSPWHARAFLVVLLLLPVFQASAAQSCGQPATPISEVQGQSDISPLVGQQVTVEGVLTLDSRMDGGFSGFYLQQADGETDNNPDTSEAVFVYTRKSAGAPGDRLRLTGTVKEFHGLTELTDIRALTACGSAPVPKARELKQLHPDALEALENMRVRTTRPLTVISSWNLARYGELTLAPGDQVIPTEYLEPGPQARQTAKQNRQHRIRLDDARSVRQPDPIPWPPGGLTGSSTVRNGDTVHGISGILDYRFGAWRLQPDEPPVFKTANPRVPAPSRPEGPHVRIMTMNLENYFNGDGRGNGFPTPRGAPTPGLFRIQSQKLTAALRRPDPDIIAVTELENDGYDDTSAIAQLTAAMGPEWEFVATPGADGNDKIRTALLYRQDRVDVEGAPRRLSSGPFRKQGRPPLAQTFRPKNRGLAIRVVVPHLKSKSCRNANAANRDRNDGQGCYAQRRSKSARALVSWLEQQPEADGFAGTLITGDFNSYFREAPLQPLKRAGFTSMVHHFHPCKAHTCNHHTFRYKGLKGSLDYAFASASLVSRVIGARTWAINADEPPALGYKANLPGIQTSPWRASDHDPVITDIQL